MFFQKPINISNRFGFQLRTCGRLLRRCDVLRVPMKPCWPNSGIIATLSGRLPACLLYPSPSFDSALRFRHRTILCSGRRLVGTLRSLPAKPFVLRDEAGTKLFQAARFLEASLKRLPRSSFPRPSGHYRCNVLRGTRRADDVLSKSEVPFRWRRPPDSFRRLLIWLTPVSRLDALVLPYYRACPAYVLTCAHGEKGLEEGAALGPSARLKSLVVSARR